MVRFLIFSRINIILLTEQKCRNEVKEEEKGSGHFNKVIENIL